MQHLDHTYFSYIVSESLHSRNTGKVEASSGAGKDLKAYL